MGRHRRALARAWSAGGVQLRRETAARNTQVQRDLRRHEKMEYGVGVNPAALQSCKTCRGCGREEPNIKQAQQVR